MSDNWLRDLFILNELENQRTAKTPTIPDPGNLSHCGGARLVGHCFLSCSVVPSVPSERMGGYGAYFAVRCCRLSLGTASPNRFGVGRAVGDRSNHRRLFALWLSLLFLLRGSARRSPRIRRPILMPNQFRHLFFWICGILHPLGVPRKLSDSDRPHLCLVKPIYRPAWSRLFLLETGLAVHSWWNRSCRFTNAGLVPKTAGRGQALRSYSYSGSRRPCIPFSIFGSRYLPGTSLAN